jgi:hypothetical protein
MNIHIFEITVYWNRFNESYVTDAQQFQNEQEFAQHAGLKLRMITSAKDMTENLKMSFVSHMESNRTLTRGRIQNLRWYHKNRLVCSHSDGSDIISMLTSICAKCFLFWVVLKLRKILRLCFETSWSPLGWLSSIYMFLFGNWPYYLERLRNTECDW